MKIANLKIGDSAKIISFEKGANAYRHRLLSMGLTPGTVFKLVRIAPLGDPLQISVRNFLLMLRKKEAAIINIEKVVS